jgi:hypothetical protein
VEYGHKYVHIVDEKAVVKYRINDWKSELLIHAARRYKLPCHYGIALPARIALAASLCARSSAYRWYMGK